MSIAYDVVTQSGVSKVTSMSHLRDLEPSDLEGAFSIHVTHGHIFRSLTHVVRDMLAYGILELTPTTMRLLRLDKTERVIVAIDIDTTRFFQYFFLSKRGIIRIGISFAVLWQCIKVVGKQDSFIMSKNDGDDYMVLDFGDAARQQYPLQGVCEQEIRVPIYLSRQPNIYVTVKELTKAMSYFRNERGRARIKGFRDRLVVEALGGKKVKKMGTSFEDVWRRVGLTPDRLQAMLREDPSLVCSLHLNDAGTGIAELDITQSYPKYGAVGATPTVDIVQSHLVLKSLSKVYTIAPNSGVVVTVEKGLPIRLVIPIGDYGYLTLYLLTSTWNSGLAAPVGAAGAAEQPLSPMQEVAADTPPPAEDVEVRPRRSSKRKPKVVAVEETVIVEEEEPPAPVVVAPSRPRKRAPKKKPVVMEDDAPAS